ncbi:hypothetical protein LCGC14_0800720 [marine sediment metagenome]|uniref:Uncharacterized protein n=1 Tax=marine sediment metagenome TaxID=412755 RepID=A0A0F9SWV6_9ZZZZ
MKFVRLVRYRAYFISGHSQWLFFPVWLGNTLIIWYQLLFKEFDIFQNIYIFSLLFLSFYIPIAVLAGRWNYKNKSGTMKIEHSIIREYSPLWIEINEKLDRLLDEN